MTCNTISTRMTRSCMSPSRRNHCNHARNLGVILDTHLSLNDHIATVCKASHFHHRNISNFRKFLTKGSTQILTHTFVSSKLDYCNSLLYGLPAHQLNKLQLIQNAAVHIISFARKYDHITPVLGSLHRLLVQSRIILKILLLVYKALNGMPPSYPSNMLRHRMSTRTLRSTSQNFLAVSRT